MVIYLDRTDITSTPKPLQRLYMDYLNGSTIWVQDKGQATQFTPEAAQEMLVGLQAQPKTYQSFGYKTYNRTYGIE